jgi:hypothetical protein
MARLSAGRRRNCRWPSSAIRPAASMRTESSTEQRRSCAQARSPARPQPMFDDAAPDSGWHACREAARRRCFGSAGGMNRADRRRSRRERSRGRRRRFRDGGEMSFERRRRCCSIGSAGELEPGCEVGRNDALPQGARGTAGLAASGRARGAMSAACHRVAPSWSGNRDRMGQPCVAIWSRRTAAVCRSGWCEAGGRPAVGEPVGQVDGRPLSTREWALGGGVLAFLSVGSRPAAGRYRPRPAR